MVAGLLNGLRRYFDQTTKTGFKNSKHIRSTAASAANASGSLQTALSKLTRRSDSRHRTKYLRRVSSDRVLAFLRTRAMKKYRQVFLAGTGPAPCHFALPIGCRVLSG